MLLFRLRARIWFLQAMVAVLERKQQKVRLLIDVTPEVDEFLTQVAIEEGITRAEVLRRALALLYFAHEGHRAGFSLGFHSDPCIFDQLITGY